MTIPCATNVTMQTIDITDSCIEVTMPRDPSDYDIDCHVKFTMDPASQLYLQITNYNDSVRDV